MRKSSSPTRWESAVEPFHHVREHDRHRTKFKAVCGSARGPTLPSAGLAVVRITCIQKPAGASIGRQCCTASGAESGMAGAVEIRQLGQSRTGWSVETLMLIPIAQPPIAQPCYLGATMQARSNSLLLRDGAVEDLPFLLKGIRDCSRGLVDALYGSQGLEQRLLRSGSAAGLSACTIATVSSDLVGLCYAFDLKIRRK